MSSEKIKIDDLPIGKFHIKIMALTFGAHLNDGYILGLIGMAMTLLGPDLELTSTWKGIIAASALFGLFLGSLFAGIISDRIGRQKIFLLSFVIIAIGSAAQYFADSPLQLVLCRLLIGIGIGGDYSVGHALLAEFCPRKHRGVILGSFSVIWTVGYVAATFFGKYIIDKDMGPESWRIILASSTIPALFILIARIGTPESPRWLANQGREAEAQKVLDKHLGPNVILGDEVVDTKNAGFAALFTPKYIKRTLFNCIFFACLVMPYFAIYSFLPSILETMGLSYDFTVDTIINCMLILGAFIGIACTIAFSRRGFLIGAFAILTVALATLAVVPGNLIVLQIVILAAFTLVLSAVSNLVGVFPAESFPTEVRSSGIGLATAMSRLGSAISTFLLPIMVAGCGLKITLLSLAGVLLVGLIVSYMWAPETKGRSLAQVSRVD